MSDATCAEGEASVCFERFVHAVEAVVVVVADDAEEFAHILETALRVQLRIVAADGIDVDLRRVDGDRGAHREWMMSHV